MAESIAKKEFIRRIAERMQSDEATATRWLDGVLDEMYQTFRSSYGLTLPGFGGFYLDERPRWLGLQVQPQPEAARALRLVLHLPWSAVVPARPCDHAAKKVWERWQGTPHAQRICG